MAHNPVLNSIDHKRIADKWCMNQLALLMARLKAVPEAGATKLANTVILLTNHMEDVQPRYANLPWALAGQAGGYFKTGTVRRAPASPSTVR